MTRISYTIRDNIFTLSIKGHAGYAEMGSDIVCSAISTLAQTLIACLENEADDVEAIVDPGDVWIWAAGPKAIAAFSFAMTGFRLIERSYGKYITIVEGVP